VRRWIMNGIMVAVMLPAILVPMLGLGSCVNIYPQPQQSVTIPAPNSETTPEPSPASMPVAQISGDKTFTCTLLDSNHMLPLYLGKGQILELQWRLDGEDGSYIYYPWYIDPQGRVKWKYTTEQSGRRIFYHAGEGAPYLACREGIRQMIADVAGVYTFYFAVSDIVDGKPFDLYVSYESKAVSDPELLNPPKTGGEFRFK
jgi:hypothetical protein